MGLFRLIGNAFRIIGFVGQSLLYWPAYILGSKIALVFWLGVGAYLIHLSGNNAWIYAGVVPWVFFRVMLKNAKKPNRLVLFRAPAPPPPPPPSASTAKGRADDPSEATVIGRLDPRLRELLRQKPDGAAS